MIKVVTGILVMAAVLVCSELKAQVAWVKTGAFDELADIGGPAMAGTAVYRLPEQKYHLAGSGANIWSDSDSFSLLWKRMSGDCIVQTQIRFIGSGQELHRKTGIMFRQSQAADSPMVACTVHGDGLTSLQYRAAKGGMVQEIKLALTGPEVIQLERKGNSYIMSAARFGEVYQTRTVENVDWGAELMAGLFVCSHNNEFTEEVEFCNTRVFKPAPETLVQYKEYLGSLLEVMDIETGLRRVVASAGNSWQAPNWTGDGKTLIYNADGLLYQFDLTTRESVALNTDFANKNNNDHVLSFDGRQIGISHHAAEANGESVVYTLPAGGGVPRKITARSPSYLHGWSPDGRFVLYTGKRGDDFDIYKIAVEGGEEVQLTKTQGLDDGAEYSPDGGTIYFCSARTGVMQIWKMDANGDNQTQLTADELNNWFGHVSPDNKWIVFLSFPKEVPADQHPFYQRVYLRLMPAGGGPIKVIGYLYGGQGTINVPSWSPDSKKIAFVSNGNFE